VINAFLNVVYLLQRKLVYRKCDGEVYGYCWRTAELHGMETIWTYTSLIDTLIRNIINHLIYIYPSH
jgi:hypothetical protein